MTTFKKSQHLIAAIIALCLIAGLGSTFVIAREAGADSITPVSTQFIGIVKDTGIVVPAGYTIIAKVEGVQKATTKTNDEGKYGYGEPFVITAYEGKTVEFWINGILADQTGIIQEGALTFLNLTILSGNPPSPSATTTTTGSLPAPGTYVPTFLRGTIMNDGTLVPAGYTLVAKVNGVQYASTKTNAEGKFGFDSVFGVAAQDGDVIVFYINGVRADQTYSAEGGSMAQIDLTYKDIDTSTTPAPTTTTDTGSAGTPATTPATNNYPAPSPKSATEPAPQNSNSESTAQPVIIGFIAVMAVLCLGLIYAIMKRRQPQH